jgi:preprotein translocase subunit SecA
MEILQRIGDGVAYVLGGALRLVERGITTLFGSSNARYLKRLQPRLAAINALEPKYLSLTDAELRAQTELFKKRLAAGETLDDLLVEAFAVVREAGRRWLGMRHYDVQLLGGMVLHNGCIAEMVTGEGKTLVATLPAYLNALEGRGVHVVTVNDYLARRDMEWMGPLYLGLGLTVGAIYADMDPEERQRAYGCDITYGTNNEFGFDYLRDNMKPAARGDDRFPKRFQQVQRGLHYAIIDEVDNILIDEARTPLIIAGPAHDDVSKYQRADRIARTLVRDVHFEVREKEHTCHLTEAGVREAEKLAGVESFYTAGNMEWPHLIDNALKAHYLYRRDVHYMVEDGEVVIVDEHTGRPMRGRHWSDGLHQAVEAKEGVRIKEENQTLATITLQNFFKLYKKICGMTGTAMTEATEFWKVYKLDVIAIPTNKPLRRINHPDVIYLTERAKYEALADEVERMHKWDIVQLDGRNEEIVGTIKREDDQYLDIIPAGSKTPITVPRAQVVHIQRRGRPVLIGTVSIEKSERVSRLLEVRGIPHQVLNAKHHKREAEIVAQAGRLGAVTIATNMAGRGTDIILGGNPETMAWAQLQDKYPTRLEVPKDEWDQLVRQIEQREKMKEEGRLVASLGGLHIIGTERHEARRIDNQLRGRSGRQGDPGSSRFYLSLEDDLMRIFAGDWVRGVLQRLGMKEHEAIESRMVSRRIEAAQRKVEERNFERRKNLLEFDEVMDEQRKRVYGYRQRILQGASCKPMILEMIHQQIDKHLDQFLDPDYGPESFCRWVSNQLGVEGLEPHEFRGVDYETAVQYAKDSAERLVEEFIQDSVEENLPDDEDESEWNWEALARTVNSRWKLGVRDRDLKKLGRDQVGPYLIDRVLQVIRNVDCSEGSQYLDPDFGLRNACGWLQYKFDLRIAPEEVRHLEAEELKQHVRRLAEEAYQLREAQYAVLAGVAHFTQRDMSGQRRFDREGLARWARQRFGVEVTAEQLQGKSADELMELLLPASQARLQRAPQVRDEALQRLDALQHAQLSTEQRAAKVRELAAWLGAQLGADPAQVPALPDDPQQCRQRVLQMVEDHFYGEIRRMERMVLLEVLDTAWKDHLLAMDHLRSGIGLVGYAQKDVKVEYKREGMRTFESMWDRIGQQTTDLVFRMQQLDEGFVSSTWAGSQARHDEAAPASDIARQQQAAMQQGASDRKLEPIRNRDDRVGRNDPCPCGSGKKFKQCCMRKQRDVA